MESFYWMLVWKIFFLLKFIQIIWNPPILSQKVFFYRTFAEATRRHVHIEKKAEKLSFPFFQHSVQFSCSVVSNSLRPHGLQHARLPCQHQLPSNHLILCYPLLLPPSIFPSIRVFSNESVLRIRWPKYWSFSIGPSNEYSGAET